MRRIILFFLITFLTLPAMALAGVGVGVNLGKINIDEPLKPGGIYNFPSIGVINTGDEPGDYELAVTYHEDQAEFRPLEEWFSFSPAAFSLEPSESRNVAITMTLPMRVKPGDYFAYLEAHPVVLAGPGTTIGIAAATKTYFTVSPANIGQAIYYKISSLLVLYAPWTYIVLSVILSAIVILLFKKYFSFQIGISRKGKEEKESSSSDQLTDPEDKEENNQVPKK